jgi:hypothetical protein
MTDPDDIPNRVSRLEHEVRLAREDAAAARVLAGGADRDVSAMRTELRAHIKSLEALRKTQLEQSDEMRDGFADVRAEMRDGFAKADTRFAEVETTMRDGFTKLALGQSQITALLNIAIGRSDQD